MQGFQIGKKFDASGAALRYPGNTVIADVRPGCAAYDVMTQLKSIAAEAGLKEHLILMPEDSYHMTVIRGLNDGVRTDGFWPATLDRETPFERVDDYVEAAAKRAGLPDGIRMRFTGVRVNEEDFRVLVAPADEAQAQMLRAFRNRMADALALRLPGHDAYTYHITLAYTLTVLEGEALVRASRAIRQMEAALDAAPTFVTTPPYVAFYDDMLTFHSHRIPRRSAKGVNDR